MDLLFMLSYYVDVAHQPIVFGAFDCRSLEQRPIMVDVEPMPVFPSHHEQLLLWAKFCNFCRTGKAVPRAYQLATVTSIDVQAHLVSNLLVNLITVLYGLVGQTAVAVE